MVTAVLSIAATVKLIGPPAVQWSTPAQQPVRIVPNRRLQKLAQITDIATTDGNIGEFINSAKK